MIIYPQINNLKVVVVPLMVLVLLLGFNSYKSYNTLKELNTYLAEENDNVARELYTMILEYHELDVNNLSLKSKLEVSRNQIVNVLDSVQNLKPNLALVKIYKKQLGLLKKENNKILYLVEQLSNDNQKLLQKADRYATALNTSNINLTKSKNESIALSSTNFNLQEQNKNLTKILDSASKILPKIALVQGVRREKSNRKLIITESANKTKKLNIAIKFPENQLAEKGEQAYFMQVIDPKGNVVGERTGVPIKNRQTLINSKKIVVDYQNKALTKSYFIEKNLDDPFVEGLYHVGLYNSKGLIENTTFTLR